MNEKELLELELYSLGNMYYCIDEKKDVFNRTNKILDSFNDSIKEAQLKANSWGNIIINNIDVSEANSGAEIALLQEKIDKVLKKCDEITNKKNLFAIVVGRENIEIKKNEEALEKLCNQLCLIRPNYRSKNTVFALISLYEDGVATTWRELVVEYEARLFRHELLEKFDDLSEISTMILHGIERVSFQLDSIDRSINAVSNQLNSIKSSINATTNLLGQFYDSTKEFSFKLYNEVSSIKPYFNGLIQETMTTLPTLNQKSEPKVDKIDHSMCLICVSRNTCKQMWCKGFSPRND